MGINPLQGDYECSQLTPICPPRPLASQGGKELHFSHLFGLKADQPESQGAIDGHCSVMDLHRIMVNAGGVNHVRPRHAGSDPGGDGATPPPPRTPVGHECSLSVRPPKPDVRSGVRPTGRFVLLHAPLVVLRSHPKPALRGS